MTRHVDSGCPTAWVVGEVLLDHYGVETYLGGAPANVAVGLCRHGCPVVMTTAVGEDQASKAAVSALRNVGVDVVAVVKEGCTVGACDVRQDSEGTLHFHPRPLRRADLRLGADDVENQSAAVLIHGTVSYSSKDAKSAILSARKQHDVIAVDINLRPAMFGSESELRQAATEAMAGASIVKATRQEAIFVAGSVTAFVARGQHITLLSDEDRPAQAFVAGRVITAPVPALDVVDATGAGDAFFAAALARLLRDASDVEGALGAGVAAGGKACLHRGATAMLLHP